MQAALLTHNDIVIKRNALTPLARNERICRVTIVKKPETRADHIYRLTQDLVVGLGVHIIDHLR
jgi:hypothetical protein